MALVLVAKAAEAAGVVVEPVAATQVAVESKVTVVRSLAGVQSCEAPSF
jgi:hypothetical protein